MRKYLHIKKNQKGYTLLEYCAGAAIMTGIVWVALTQLGNSLGGFLNQLGSWADSRAANIRLDGGDSSGVGTK